MPNLNRVMLMGNLTRDPELRYLPSNSAVVSFGLAINRKWRDQQGEQQEEVTFVDCEAFGRLAEIVNQYLSKGRPAFIEGRLKLDQWQAQDGSNRSKLKVIAEQVQFIDSAAGHSDDRPEHRRQQAQRSATSSRRAPAMAGAGAPGEHEPLDEDSMPF